MAKSKLLLTDPALVILLGGDADALVAAYKQVKVATMRIGNQLQNYIATGVPDDWMPMPTGYPGKPDFMTTDKQILLQVKNAYNSGNSAHREVYTSHGSHRWHRMNKNGTTNWVKLCQLLGVAETTLTEVDFLKYLLENK